MINDALPWLSVRRLRRIADEFKPDAILSVAHGYGWRAAWKLAESLGIPLHLIVHDDWPPQCQSIGWFRRRSLQQFAHAYRCAASRLCVSPFMVDEYKERYGASGTLLYPGRSAKVPEFPSVVERGHEKRSLRYAFAGTLSAPDIALGIQQLAEVLEPTGGLVLLYGPFDLQQLRESGLSATNVVVRGLIASDKIIQTLHDEADVLFVPLSFDPAMRSNMSIHIPSKLTDYTATGVPILVYGPKYSSAVRWGEIYSDAVITTSSRESLAQAVCRLQDSEVRAEFGRKSQDVGRHLFSHGAVESVFFGALESIYLMRRRCDQPSLC